jgi:histidinol-phosphate/aromatic aminotransferase/cobyric acid decarboxylase-like protein
VALHGGRTYYELKKSLSENKIHDLSISVNPYSLPFDASGLFQDVSLKHYPDSSYEEVVRLIAAREGADPRHILATSGASEGINVVSAFLKVHRPHSSVLLVGPLYGGYASAFDAFQILYSEIRMSEEKGFAYDLDSIVQEIKKKKPGAIFICNPCNPTGRLLDNDRMKLIEDACHKAGTILVIDESYRWLCSDSLPFPAGEGTIVIKSLTKEYGMPGLRMGFLRAREKLLSALSPFVMYWSMSVPAVFIAIRALGLTQEFAGQWKRLNAESKAFSHDLARLGFSVHPSEAPFFLAKKKGASDLAHKALAKGLILRECTSFGLSETIRFGTCADYGAVMEILTSLA